MSVWLQKAGFICVGSEPGAALALAAAFRYTIENAV